jgi:predicted esterase
VTTREPMLRSRLPVLAALLAFASAGSAQAPATPHRTGEFQAVLAARSPESDARRWSERFQFGGSLERWDYDLADESFSLYVPSDYDANGAPYGLVVWVSAFDSGAVPPELRPALDARRLIWIGPNDDGNSRHLFPRMGLALDAVRNALELYHIDPDRIFVSGLSGGGKVAAMLAVAWPDVFSGGFPIIGMTTYLDVPLASSPGQSVYRFARPAPALLERAKKQPLVIMTGSGDFNREECRLTAAAYERDGFTDLHLMDVEGMGHEMPTPESFARGLDRLLAATVGAGGAADR